MINNTMIKQLGQETAVTYRNRFKPSLLAAIGVLMVTFIALFTAPYVGMADNGDFFRIIYSNGLYFNSPHYDDQYFGYFVRQYGIYQYFNENGATLNSSQSLFIKLAIGLNKLLFSREVFDIRFQAAIYTLLYVLAVYLLIEAITWKMPRRPGIIIAVTAIFIFGDTGYTAYFNSFYSESVVMIMMIFVFASWLLLCRKRYNDYLLLFLFVAGSILLTASKQQNAPVGIIIACLSLTLLWVRKDKVFRLLTLGAMGLLLFTGIAVYQNISKEFVNINQYHSMTRGVLKESANPETALKAFGINEQYAILNGSIYYEQYGTVDLNSQRMEDEFYNKFGFLSILQYYVTHPAQFGSILNEAAKSAFTIKPAAMGNYEESSGKAFREQSHFFTLYSLLKEKLAPKTFGFIVLWMVAIIGIYLPSFIRQVRSANFRGMQQMVLILTTMAVGLSGILVSIIGAGDADISKHEFLFTLSFDLVTFLALSGWISRWFKGSELPEAPDITDSYQGGHKGVSA
ncbi:hypothetical protein [Paenibacillus sp. sgz500958]|uniref:glycan biosynthesis hexose transferase WsfD n=1 Tax=Paenibacillus sp. sgz500958 TaxID=3242475 RepID=UPI0036D360D2